MQGAGLERVLPYLLLAPALLLFLAVFVYPLIEGVRASTTFYRFGRPIGSVGLQNYGDVLRDPLFRGALSVTLKFVFIAVPLEAFLGLALALLCAREVRFIRAVRTMLIVPMVIMPVVVGIVFRLIYASDVGLMSAVSRALGGGSVQTLGIESRSFAAIIVMDVWEWTPLMFLILLAGIQSLPVEPFEAARVDGASPWRTFWDHTFPMLRPVFAVAIVLRTIDAFGTFDSVFILTNGGPGTATQLISIYGYKAAFRFTQFGFAAAMMLMVSLLVLALAFLAVRLIRRRVET
jgi:multiple sugar transport system permease protein